MAIADLANPSRFLSFADRTIPWLGGLTLIVFAYGIDQAMLAPDDYQQGANVKIMFLHVPSAWVGREVGRRARHAGVAASARRRRGESGGADRRGVHAVVSHHRLTVGAAG